MLFEAQRWIGEIISTFQSHWTIGSLLVKMDVAETRPDFREVIEIFNEFGDPSEKVEKYFRSTSGDIESARKLYSRQMIVVAATYVELIVKDFVLSLFVHSPERMHDFLYFQDKEDSRGIVHLKDILKAGSKEEIIVNLSDQAAANLLKGKFSTSLTRLIKLIKENFPEDLRNDLIETVEKRNKIVHESSKEEVVRNKDIVKAQRSCIRLVLFLTSIARKQGIQLDDVTVIYR